MTGLDGGREKGETGLEKLGLEGGVTRGGVADGVLLPDGTVAGLEGRWEEGETEPMKYNYKTKIVLAVWLCS